MSDKHPPKQTAAAGEENPSSESEWGLEGQKRGMSKEGKIGILLILLLIAAFGFVVYKRAPKDFWARMGKGRSEKVSIGKTDPPAPGPAQGLHDAPQPDAPQPGGGDFDHDHAGHSHGRDHGGGIGGHVPGRYQPRGPAPKPNEFASTAAPTPSEAAQVAQAGSPFPNAGDASQAQAPAPLPDQAGQQAAANAPDPFGAVQPDPATQPAPVPTDIASQPPQFDPQSGAHGGLGGRTAQARFADGPGRGGRGDSGSRRGERFPQGDQSSGQQYGDAPPPDTNSSPAPRPDGLDQTAQANPPAPFESQDFSQTAAPTPAIDLSSPAPVPDGNGQVHASDGFPGRNRRNGRRGDDHDHAVEQFEPADQAQQASHDPFRPGRRRGNDFDVSNGGGAMYTVEPNDNFWIISKKVYGTGRYYEALARFNEANVPDTKNMRPGLQVVTPPQKILEARFPEMFRTPTNQIVLTSFSSGPPGMFYGDAGQPMYRVGKGDTLTGIAQAHFGRASRWIQIYHINRQILTDPQSLTVGTELALPPNASRVQVVRAIEDGR